MKKMRVIFVGTGRFGCPVLEKLVLDNRFIIPLVITGQDKKAGRGMTKQSSPVKKTALLNKLIIQQPGEIIAAKQKIIQAEPDFLLVVAFGEIIPKEILSIPRFGSINIHASLLPKYRGASPIQEALLRGEQKTGITWIKMNEKMDAGDIISQEPFAIDDRDDAESLAQKLSALAALKTPDILKKFLEKKKSSPQNQTLSSYCKKIKKENGIIDVYRETAAEIIAKIRAYFEWPGCFLILNNRRIKIMQAKINEQKMSSGELRILNGKTLLIGTLKGTLELLSVQPESKRRMTIEEFLRGTKPISS